MTKTNFGIWHIGDFSDGYMPELCASFLTADVHRKQLLSFHRCRRCPYRLSSRDRSICGQDSSLKDEWFSMPYENASSRGLDPWFISRMSWKVINPMWIYQLHFLYYSSLLPDICPILPTLITRCIFSFEEMEVSLAVISHVIVKEWYTPANFNVSHRFVSYFSIQKRMFK